MKSRPLQIFRLTSPPSYSSLVETQESIYRLYGIRAFLPFFFFPFLPFLFFAFPKPSPPLLLTLSVNPFPIALRRLRVLLSFFSHARRSRTLASVLDRFQGSSDRSSAQSARLEFHIVPGRRSATVSLRTCIPEKLMRVGNKYYYRGQAPPRL